MSSSRLLDLERLVQPPTKVARSEPPDRLGGLDDLLDKAMDFSDVTEVAGMKTDVDDDPEDLMDFNDFLVGSKSTVKSDFGVVKTDNISTKTAMEVIDAEPTLLPGRVSGASTLSLTATNADSGNKKYKLFVCPGVVDCVRLCKTLIGQGTTVCMSSNCLKNHRQKRAMSILPGQIFVAKGKDIVFAEPTIKVLVENDMIEEWKVLNLTVSQWREKFKIVNQVAKKGSNVETKTCKRRVEDGSRKGLQNSSKKESLGNFRRRRCERI